MLGSIMLGSLRKTLLLTATGAVFCLSGNSIAAAPRPVQDPNPSTSPSSPRFVVLTQPVKVKIAYGETILPAGMKLPVVSSDTTSVRVNYMGELQTIPIGAARFEASEPRETAPSEIPPIVPTKPPAVPSTTPGPQLQVSLQPGYDSRMQGGDISMRELQSLLSSYCSEGVALSGAGTKVYSGGTYLMDSDQAATHLGRAHGVPSSDAVR